MSGEVSHHNLNQLFSAIDRGDLRRLTTLLDKGFCPKTLLHFYSHPAAHAAKKGATREYLQAFIDRGLVPKDTATAADVIQSAIECEIDPGRLPYFLAQGYNPDALRHDSATTMMDVVTCLLHRREYPGRFDPAETKKVELQTLRAIQILLDHGSNPNVESRNGDSAWRVILYSPLLEDVREMCMEHGF